MANVNKAQNPQLRPTKSTQELRISLLGSVIVEINGAPVTIPSKKARALLGYLVQRSGTDVARSTVTGLLWSERGEEQARASLRQTLSELRAALANVEKPPINANNETITWVAGSAWIDSQEFKKAAKSDDDKELREAALLVRGEFMEGLSIEEAAFEHWLAGERERLRQLASALYARLMERAEGSGDIESALNHGLKLISLDPLQEQVHRSLMRFYAAQGRNDAALAQYERCKAELSSQLGVQPEAETETLARSIKSGRRQGPATIEVLKPITPALPDKPSIAVLPFTNLSSDKEQEYFADAVTEDIIGALSRVPDLFVISRTSSFFYKGRPVRVEDAARELGVVYILEGSIRVAGNRVRVSAQLIDGRSGGHVWAERFEQALDDLFAVQDEITRSIALALQVKLTQGESARLWEGQTKNLRAWENMVLARQAFQRFTTPDNAQAREFLEKAILIDPNCTSALARLGMTYYWDARYSVSVDRAQSLKLASECVERILTLNPEMATSYTLRGAIAYTSDQFDEAIIHCEKAVALAPSDSWALGFMAMVYLYCGDTERATIMINATMRLSPHTENWMIYYSSLVALWRGDFSAANDYAELYLQKEPDEPYGYVYMAVIQGFQNQMDNAAKTVARLKQVVPTFTIKNIILSQRYKERENLDRIVKILREAGLSE